MRCGYSKHVRLRTADRSETASFNAIRRGRRLLRLECFFRDAELSSLPPTKCREGGGKGGRENITSRLPPHRRHRPSKMATGRPTCFEAKLSQAFRIIFISACLQMLVGITDCLPSPEVVCSNIDIRNSVENFRKLENCTVVEGYLQILLIDNGQAKDYENISFPKLTEVSGYLLLYRAFGLNSVGKLFPNLAVIRGNILFHNYAFVVFEMYQLQEIGLSLLTDILRGSVRIEKNPSLCYVDTIDWDRIAKEGRGGHFIKANKKWEECPNTCPENKDCPVVTRDSGKPYQLCWNSNHCQKTCSPDCERHNLTCSARGSRCCHQECLGGCSGQFSVDCVACKHVVYQGRCMKKCPSNTFEYMNHRCVEEDECKNYSKDHYQGKVFWKPFQGQCLQECPTGYMEVEHDRHRCKNCTDRCPKVCQGVNVNNVAAAQGLRGCTYINGSLAIEIKGGHNVIKELEENLNMIQEIQGYLKIARAYPLISLDFLKALTVIHGSELHKQNYALLVLDNPNLQELWDWEHRKKKLHIRGGKVFFHFNSKLCPSKIMDLKKYADVSDWDDRDVSPSSNGDRVACDVTNMNVSVPIIESRVAKIRWQSFKTHLHDSRSLLGYVIYYREAPYPNVTIFEGRDACGADAWKVRDVEITDDSDEINYIMYNLKPYTQYALYIRTYTTASGRQGAQSSITYFKTKADTPTTPLNIKARSTLHGEVVISWRPPKTPNGNVTHYIAQGVREVDSVDFINQRNYCLEPLSIPAYKKSDYEDTTSKAMWWNATTTVSPGQGNSDCCPCAKGKAQLEDEEEEAEFQIHFEDFLHNNVYIKNPVALNVERHRRSVNSASVATTSSDSPKFTVSSIGDSTVEPIYTAVGDIEEEGVLIEFHRSVYHHTFLVVSRLRHFTEYTIEVRACQDRSPEITSDPCSSKAITTVRTLPLGGADDINSKTLVVQTVNVTARSGLAKWEEPKYPNGVVVAYHMEYKRLNVENNKPVHLCITRTAYLQYGGGYVLTDLAPGNYSIRVRSTSLAGFGNWTEMAYFSVPVLSDGWTTEAVIFVIIGSVVTVLIICGVSYTMHKKFSSRIPDNIIYASVNPEYMSAGLVYEPDEWEIPRGKIKLLNELGQGSFGMVYEGEVQDLEDGKPLIRCAAKTVNESASLRERIEFLQEASVMKAFNCRHVIKLLGVVSKGHPTLVIMELMANGDLKSYLRSHRPGSEEHPDRQPPSVEQMFKMAAEISDGMAYLGAKKFVHRDLAARNCMVAEDLTVKIGDFGMTRDIYETDYYRKGGKGLLPVRWMAPESLQDGIFDCQSDVWSFGVVLWEMVTLASQPYQGLANEQVLKYVIDGGRMEKPEGCPEKLYSMMVMSWDKNPKARPTFTEIIEMLLPDVSEKFFEQSFYFTQKPGMCAQEVDFTELATPSTPLRSPVFNDGNLISEELGNSDLRYFPCAMKLPGDTEGHAEVRNGVSEPECSRHPETVQNSGEGSKGLSIYSNDSSIGVAVNYSDGSKGSKVSTMSNGSLANGHVNLSSLRTSEC